VSSPVLVSKGNVMIGYNPIYEYTALPDAKRMVEAVRRVMSGSRSAGLGIGLPAGAAPRRDFPASPTIEPARDESVSAGRIDVMVKVPVMGEGFGGANRIIVEKPEELVALDGALCEVETDKAVYPVESRSSVCSRSGVAGR
jgi:2-oxoisovalerate dehydrogenase E1 component